MWKFSPTLEERFRVLGGNAMSDSELLELIFRRLMPVREAHRLAIRLILRFGSFADAVGAEPHRLEAVPGSSDDVLDALAVIQEATTRIVQVTAENRPLFKTPKAAKAYCERTPQRRPGQRVLYLNKGRRLLLDDAMEPATARAILRRCLEVGACAVIVPDAPQELLRQISATGRHLNIMVDGVVIDWKVVAAAENG